MIDLISPAIENSKHNSIVDVTHYSKKMWQRRNASQILIGSGGNISRFT